MGNDKVKQWTNDHPIMTENSVKDRFLDITKDFGHTSDGQDVKRHILGGYVSIIDNGRDVFKGNDIGMDNLQGKLSESGEVQKIRERMGVILKAFKDKAIQDPNVNIDNDIQKFLDDIADTNSGEDATIVI